MHPNTLGFTSTKKNKFFSQLEWHVHQLGILQNKNMFLFFGDGFDGPSLKI